MLEKREYCKKYSKKWRSKEKDKIYRDIHKDKINERKKEKVTCECGYISTKTNLSTHKKSKKHFNLMKEKEN